jgi:poly-gamma-glutamate synthesis protein (capsule biosynthesis protein)
VQYFLIGFGPIYTLLLIMQPGNLVIGFCGDVMIGRGVSAAISRNGYLYPWGDVLPILHRTDMNIINLETSLTNSHHKVPKTFSFRAGPDRVETLSSAQVSIANLANNHVFDFSEDGLVETINVLDTKGILHVGAGRNAVEAAEAVVVERKGARIGVIGFTDNEPGWKAGPETPGINYLDLSDNQARERGIKAIQSLRDRTDLVIISIHWGPKLQAEPAEEHVSFAHEMVGAGAHIIHGHSAHNFQGIERLESGLILYDTGDFIDDYIVDPELFNDHSFFFEVKLEESKMVQLVLTPVLIAQCQVRKAVGPDYRWSMNRVQELSRKFGTMISNEGVLLL